MEFLGLAAGFAMGIVLGLMGGGGSILTVPILVYLFSLSPSLATSYSLFIVGLTALFGSVVYLKKKEVDFLAGFFFAVPSILGVNLSRGYLLPNIPSEIFKVGNFVLTKEILIMLTFSILMISASYSMIKKSVDKKPIQVRPLIRSGLIALQGFVVGAIAGFVGAGGGFLIIPALVFMAGLPIRVAVGTSLMIIALQSLLGFAGDLFLRGLQVNWQLLLAVSIAATIGILTGSSFSHKIKEKNLKSSFGWFVLAMGLIILIEQFRHLAA